MRREQDQFFKILAESDPRGLLDILGILPLDREAEVVPLDRELVRDPVLIDQGFAIREPDSRWIAHIEAFTDIRDDDWERVLWYAADLAVRTRLPVRSTVLLMLEHYAPRLVPERNRRSAQLGSFGASLDIEIVCLWKVPAAKLLLSGRPRLITWVPMTNASEEDCVAAANAIAAARDRVLTGTFRLLGEVRYGKNSWEEFLERRGLHMVTNEFLLEHSPTYRAAWDKALKQELAGRQLSMLARIVDARFPALSHLIPGMPAFLDIDEGRLNSVTDILLRTNDESEARTALDSLR